MSTRQWTEYKAHAKEIWDFQFQCPSCGYTSQAVAAGEGYGSARHEGWSSSSGTAQLAQDQAMEGSLKSARELVNLAPCPRCHKRRFGRVLKHVFITFLITTLIGSCGGGCTFGFTRDETNARWVLLGGGILVLLVAVFYLWANLSTIGRAAREVIFERPPEER